MDEFQEAIFGTHLEQGTVQRVRLARLLPLEPVLLRSIDHTVTQTLDVIAREQELDGCEERANEVLLLVADVLADAFADADPGTLQLNDAQSDAVDVEHDVGPLGVLASDRDLLGDHEMVGLRVAQSIGQTVSVVSPTSRLTFTP